MLQLEKFEKQYVKDLVKILNTDDVLKERLCPSVVDKITEDEFWIKTNDWITKRNSKYFVILINGAVCGTISLSKVRNGVFNCGYWLEVRIGDSIGERRHLIWFWTKLEDMEYIFYMGIYL